MPTFKYERMELKKRFRGGKKISFINALVKLRLSKHVLFVYSSDIKIVDISLVYIVKLVQRLTDGRPSDRLSETDTQKDVLTN